MGLEPLIRIPFESISASPSRKPASTRWNHSVRGERVSCSHSSLRIPQTGLNRGALPQGRPGPEPIWAETAFSCWGKARSLKTVFGRLGPSAARNRASKARACGSIQAKSEKHLVLLAGPVQHEAAGHDAPDLPEAADGHVEEIPIPRTPASDREFEAERMDPIRAGHGGGGSGAANLRLPKIGKGRRWLDSTRRQKYI